MMSLSQNQHSYKLGKIIIKEWIQDLDDLKTDIKSTVMDWLESYVANGGYDDELYEAEELDNTDSGGVRSSIEDALNDWCDEHLFK